MVNGTTKYIDNAANIKGPVANYYNPTYDTIVKFKGGERSVYNSDTWRSKNTVIFVTALGGLSVTVPTEYTTNVTRILQTTPPPVSNLTLSMQVSSVYWDAGFLGITTAFATLATALLVSLAF